MSYDIYDIIYRNDSTVRGILEKDPLFLKAGLIELRDAQNQLWYFYKKAGILIPGRQDYLDRTYGIRETLPRIKKIRIGRDECECSLPDADCAKELFGGLAKISACAEWKIEKRVWKLLSPSTLYDGSARMVRPGEYLDRVTILKCVYASDKKTKRRNMTDFSGWDYSPSSDTASEEKAAIPQAVHVMSTTMTEFAATNTTMSNTASQAETAASESAISNAASQAETAASERAISGAAEQAETAASESAISNAASQAETAASESAISNTASQAETAASESAEPLERAASSAAVLSEKITTGVAVLSEKITSGAAAALKTAASGVAELSRTAASSAAALSEKITSNAAASSPLASASEGQSKDVPDSEQPQTTVPKSELPKTIVLESELPETIESNPDARSEEHGNSVNVQDLLDCDKRRCRLESYEENMLYDIKRGHWDLFGGEIPENAKMGKLISRDPRKDIKSGIVGIDFGTKSTVVVRQDDTNAIVPVRIGVGMLSADLQESDYENPTIIECTNLDAFVDKYYKQPGRPETSCDDFFVSYDAFNGYRSCSPNEFYAYYADLKQWANHEKDNVRILDKQKKEYQFGAQGSKEDKIINPIELYAYYIGMYVNNMRNGIYMKYLMSFPVGYSKETRQLIVESFEKGIKKSLPTCILEDEECMKQFSVRLGISEPAAYAVTALEMSDLEPKDENEKYWYGIFDFGGGTADFGFGVWRGASEEEYEIEGYDYVLECSGADSDVTLGGEKILELLAYAVFKKNRDMARRKRITCSLPFGEQAFLGSEALLSNSQIAQRNMSILKEELRPLWHQEKNWEEKYRHVTEEIQNGEGGWEEYMELSMYDIDGKLQPNCKFVIDTQELIALIKARIQIGVDAFFKCMSKAFKKGEMPEDREVYIFLAGNSSKSVFVKELFENAIQGTCLKLMEPLNAENKMGYEYVPNAKTSVAYGLIKSREGSSIKVERNFETDAGEQTRFKYYLGRERRRYFDCRLSPGETEYGSWVKFQGAAKQMVRIYYTANPVADVREDPLLIDNIPYKEITITPQAGAFIFIRTCEPTVIEYTVSFSKESIGEENDIRKVDFGM